MRGLGSISAGLALAWHEHPCPADALPGSICKGVQDSGNRRVGGKNPYEHDRDSGKRNDESNQQRSQVRPTFS